ncbi:hypothetical protein D3C83_100030 [compost metagenome]
MPISREGKIVSWPMACAANWSAVTPAKASIPCVALGRTPLSHVVGLSEWTALESAAAWPKPLTTFS